MTQLAPPVLNSVADSEAVAGDELSVTFTPGVTGNTRLDFKPRNELLWQTAGLFASVIAVQQTETIAGLRPGEIYDVIAYADSGADFSNPSVFRRAVPSTGTGPIEERLMEQIKQELLGIRIANGFAFDVESEAVFLHQEVPEQFTSSPMVFVNEIRDRSQEDANLGDFTLINQFKNVQIQMWSQSQGTTVLGASPEGKRLFNAITLALKDTTNLQGLAIRVLHDSHRYRISSEKQPWVGVIAEFLVHWRHRSDNPSIKQ